MKIYLWDKQERVFSGYEWPVDQNGDEIEWVTPGLYLFGSTGSGKSEYARWWVQQWERWEFTNVNVFIDTLRNASQNRQGVSSFIHTLSTYPRMVIDDLGSETNDFFNNFGTRYTPSELFETVMFRRHELNLRTCVTTNLTPFRKGDEKRSSLERQYGPKILSRIMETFTIYNLKGDRRKNETVVMEKRHQPDARSDVPLLPEVDDPYARKEKPLTDRGWHKLIKDTPDALKPIVMKWYGIWKKEKGK